MIRILVADDHSLIRQGIKNYISKKKELSVTAEASNGDELLEHLNNGEYDLLITDLTMPGISGLDLLKQVKIIKPSLPILILSMHPEDTFGVRVLKSGASGYLTKEAAPDELLNAIEKIMRGGKYVSDRLAQKIFNNIDENKQKEILAQLSDRELEVMINIAEGKGIKEIADILCLSPTTVSTYRQRLLEKLDLKSNSELTLFALKNNLIA